MPIYSKLPDQIDAWKVGTLPVPNWVAAMVKSGKIKRRKTPEGLRYIRVQTEYGVLTVVAGDFIYINVNGDDNEVRHITRADMQKKYQIVST